MNEKLKSMMKKGSFAAYRMTENGCLEIIGCDHKIVENFFLFNAPLSLCPLCWHKKIGKAQRIRAIPQSESVYLISAIEI